MISEHFNVNLHMHELLSLHVSDEQGKSHSFQFTSQLAIPNTLSYKCV